MEEGGFILRSPIPDSHYLHMDLPEGRLLTSILYHKIIIRVIKLVEKRNKISIDRGMLLRYLCDANNKEIISVPKKPSSLKCKICGNERTSKSLWCGKECRVIAREYSTLSLSILGLYKSKDNLLFKKEGSSFILVGVEFRGKFRKLTKDEEKSYGHHKMDTHFNPKLRFGEDGFDIDTLDLDTMDGDDTDSEGIIFL